MNTVVTLYRKDGHVVKMVISGHTQYDEQGKDIVCAAVSAIVQTAALGLSEVLKLPIGYHMEDGYLEVILPYELSASLREKADVILDTMTVGIRNLLGQYSEYVQLDVKEVE